MWRGRSTYFSRYRRASPNAFSASEAASRHARGHFRFRGDQAHAFPASARHRFQQHGIAELFRNAARIRRIFDGLLRAGNHGHAGARGELARGCFRSQALHRFGRRADERDVVRRAGPREFGIFGEESVSGMQRVAPGAARDFHQLVDAKITFARGSRADRVRFVGEADVQRGAVRVAENGDGSDAHFAAGPRDAHGDFSAIGDEDFLEHEINV